MDARHGAGLVLTGTRGSGKTTVAEILLHGTEFSQPVGLTTRPARADDRGRYEYVSRAEFAALERAGELFVSSGYVGSWYGITRRELDRVWRSGRRPLLTLTPEAAARVARRPGWVVVFLDAPDHQLDRRLASASEGRADPTQRQADRRLRHHFTLVWNDGALARTVAAVCERAGR